MAPEIALDKQRPAEFMFDDLVKEQMSRASSSPEKGRKVSKSDAA
jgi:hypothetical protein